MLAPLRSFGGALTAVAAGALALRVAYVLALAPQPEGTGDPTQLLGQAIGGAGDSFFFHATANLLADGHGFVDPFVYTADGREVATSLHPPLFSFVLSVPSALGATSWTAHQLTGALLGAATVGLIGLLGRRLAGPPVGLVAAAIAALYPVLVAADGALMSEALYGLLIAAALLAALRLHQRGEPLAAAGLGALLGLATLTRTEALLLVVVLLVPLAIRGGEGRWRRLVAGAAACAVVLAPWAVRNLVVYDRPLLVSSNDATVLAGGNCDAVYGGSDIGSWRFDCVSRRTSANEAVQAGRWRREGLRYAADHAGELPGVLAARALRTWDLFQPRRQAANAEGRHVRVQQAGTAVYYVLVALAAYGAALLQRGRGPLWIVLAPALVATAASLVGYGVPRFRHAAEISIVVLAALALTRLAERRRAGARAPEPVVEVR